MTSGSETSDSQSIYNYEYFQQDDVCRFCWNRNACNDINDTWTENTKNSVNNILLDKIKNCLDIPQFPYSRPNKACDECCLQISKFHDFKTLCQETDKKLREILSNHFESNDVKIKPEDIEVEHLEEAIIVNDDCKYEKPEVNRTKRNWKYRPKRTPTYCNVCMVECETVEKFKVHNFQYHGIENGLYKCFGCEKQFKNRKSRFCHENNFCKGLKDGFKCSICDRFLPKRGVYEAHMRDHRKNVPIQLPDKMFNCQKCQSIFISRENLNQHIESEHQSDKKNYVCESCGRVFTRRDYLNKHKLTHTGEKQHVCPHCGFRTIQRSSLIVHIRKHTGERPYRCTICPQQCVSSSNLRAHLQRHLGLKSYECTICNKKFGYKVSLREHMSSHAPSPLSCGVCGAIYSRARALKRHIVGKHGGK